MSAEQVTRDYNHIYILVWNPKIPAAAAAAAAAAAVIKTYLL